MIRRVVITARSQKELKKVPDYIADKLNFWRLAVEREGLEGVRKVPGYHDEPLKGDRKGQRSIRLSKGYRAIYEVRDDGVRFVSVEEVNKHEY